MVRVVRMLGTDRLDAGIGMRNVNLIGNWEKRKRRKNENEKDKAMVRLPEYFRRLSVRA
jgi:hypothetical protein